MNNKVSIIIPAFNAAKFIKKCLDSVINQTYKNVEIIVVNDGSTDSTAQLIGEYLQKDKRVKLLNQKNSGTYLSRRNGLKFSTGEFIYNLDSDDYIEKEAIELLVDKMIATKSDIIVGNFNKIVNGKFNIISNKLPVSQEKVTLLKSLFKSEIKGFLCGNLYRREILESIDLKITHSACEDMLATTQLYSFNNLKVGIVDKPLYNYIIHDSNTSYSRKPEIIESVYEHTLIIDGMIRSIGLYTDLKNELDALKIRAWVVYNRMGGQFTYNRKFRREYILKHFSYYVFKSIPFHQNIELIAYYLSPKIGKFITQSMLSSQRLISRI